MGDGDAYVTPETTAPLQAAGQVSTSPFPPPLPPTPAPKTHIPTLYPLLLRGRGLSGVFTMKMYPVYSAVWYAICLGSLARPQPAVRHVPSQDRHAHAGRQCSAVCCLKASSHSTLRLPEGQVWCEQAEAILGEAQHRC